MHACFNKIFRTIKLKRYIYVRLCPMQLVPDPVIVNTKIKVK